MAIIAAIADDLGIGLSNRLLWDIKADMAHFRRLTQHHTVIMGLNTFRSIGRPLPNRTNIVLSPTPLDGVLTADSIDSAVELATQHPSDPVFVIGGASVYAQFLPLVDELYLTRVEGRYPADTYFPDFAKDFELLDSEAMEEGPYRFHFCFYRRKHSPAQ